MQKTHVAAVRVSRRSESERYIEIFSKRIRSLTSDSFFYALEEEVLQSHVMGESF